MSTNNVATLSAEERRQMFKALEYYNTSMIEKPSDEQVEHFKALGQKLLCADPLDLLEAEAEEVMQALYFYESVFIIEMEQEEHQRILSVYKKVDPEVLVDMPPYNVPDKVALKKPDVSITLGYREQGFLMHMMARYVEIYCDEMTPETEYVLDKVWQKISNYEPQPDEPLPVLPERGDLIGKKNPLSRF